MTNPTIEHISCVIIVKNGELTIANTLKSLAQFSQVVVYDNGSTDNTMSIAKTYANVKLVTGTFLGFGDTKNVAASFAEQDWILSLDADETLSTEFVEALHNVQLLDRHAYQIVRSNFYKSQEIKYCWKKEHITRLYNRNDTAFNDNKVHEFVITDQLTVKTLDGIVNHYPYLNISDFIEKSERYSTLFAQENVGKKKSSPLKAFLNATFTFIKKYIVKGGFLDGYPGLIISFAHMNTNFFKYMKLYEANKEQQEK